MFYKILAADVCAASKLGFNGAYNCSGDANGLSCSLTCPTGIHFDVPVMPMYTCLYSMGEFIPQPIPQCIFGKYLYIMVLQ